ncbi:hypothetical protein VQ02_19765 [Methylobacterium variabile]|uniref:Uncharacterized protein n=1 Tax=Methylobacterium variabile TaxID=298794 RepID=A0A0J6SKI3_9HYPH|nr:hypothetical protein [Methylobacterium variabile]KMO33888.1 hypothetical protein VQ02_19765 [Methylobacterium variabile]
MENVIRLKSMGPRANVQPSYPGREVEFEIDTGQGIIIAKLKIENAISDVDAVRAARHMLHVIASEIGQETAGWKLSNDQYEALDRT